jgi:lipoate-protein ligase A
MDVRLLEGEALDGFFAMAADEILLEAGTPALRLYTWAPLFLSIGHFQDPSRTLERGFLEAHRITVVRRPTGGKGVLHSGDLSYAAILPEGFAGKGYGGTIRLITGSICLGLRLLGCDAVLNEDRGQGANPSGSCFARATAHEIMARGRKIAGCAHLTRHRRFLEQGSILLDPDPALLAGCFKAGDGEGGPEAPGGTQTSLLAESGKPHAVREVMDAIEAGFREHARWNLIPGVLSEDERKAARELAERKERF